jgi:hypothetical protein
VQNIDSLKTNQFIRLRVTATPAALAPGDCDDTAEWSANTYAGNSLNGDQFTNQGTPAQRTTTLLGCITLQFVSGFEPTHGVVNTDTHVKVEAIVPGGSVVTAFAGQVTIQLVNGPSGAALSGNVATASGGVADFPNFQGNAEGAYEVRAISPGVANSSTVSFTLFAESLSCTEPQDTLPTSGGTITIEFLNPDDCTDVVYTPSFDEQTKTLTIEKPGALPVPLRITIDAWPAELAPVVENELQIPPTLVTPPDPFHPVQWCEGSDPTWTPPGDEVWCLISQSAVNHGPSGGEQFIQVTDEMALFGDAGARRK